MINDKDDKKACIKILGMQINSVHFYLYTKLLREY